TGGFNPVKYKELTRNPDINTDKHIIIKSENSNNQKMRIRSNHRILMTDTNMDYDYYILLVN
ncbi:hypothetical protein, partial [Ileibacterium valens]